MNAADLHDSPTGKAQLAALSLAALGVVYGDIGTSPIYAMRESLHGVHGVAATQANVLGLLSLILWALIIVISIKYLLFVMRADNGGEGGMIALTALVTPASPTAAAAPAAARARRAVRRVAALRRRDDHAGDLGARARSRASRSRRRCSRRTSSRSRSPSSSGCSWCSAAAPARIGAIFGPVMLLWFATLAVLGVVQIVRHPAGARGGEPAVRGALLRRTTAGTASSCSAPCSSP